MDRDRCSILRTSLLALWIVLLGGVSFAQQWNPMQFRADAPGLDQNPLRGMVPYAGMPEGTNPFPHSMEWFYLPLSDIVTAPDTYNWAPLEKQLNHIAQRGHQAVFRFYLDYPQQKTGIPTYLLSQALTTFAYDDFDNATGKLRSVSPDYNDPRLMECMTHFIRALGAKYDGDVRIAFLTAGLYGFWGEWHVLRHPLPGELANWAMTQDNKDTLLREYAAAFHKTPVLVRYPSVTPDHMLIANFGFHDDSFLNDTLGSVGWHFWPSMQKAGTTESWKLRPTGGEIYPQLQPDLWTTWPNTVGDPIGRAIQTIHATWMLNNQLFERSYVGTQRANALRAERMMGYTFFCSAARLTRATDGSTTITLRLENRGIAPVYYAWPVEIEALTAGNKILGRGDATWPLPTLMPGKTAEWQIALTNLPENANAVLLRIANPLPNGPSIAFANAEMGTVLSGWLTLNVMHPTQGPPVADR